ncbi:MAG: hypothetical protein WBN53_02675 [Thermodesulfobacteriota bacterium]
MILSGASHPILKDGVWRRRSIKNRKVTPALSGLTGVLAIFFIATGIGVLI